MENLYKKITLLMTLVLLLTVSCSKDDSSEDTSKEPVIQAGGEISRSQMVTVNLPDIMLPKNEYQGTLDGVAVTLTKSEDNKLVFLLPYSTTLGTHTLIIPALNNATVSYDVKNTTLSETPDATMVEFFNNLDTFSQTLDASPEALSVKNNLAVFNTYYANATIEEKTEIAILYKANKAQFDELFLYDYNNMTGRFSNKTRRPSISFFERAQLAVAKHAKAVALMASGVALITVGSPVVVAAGVAAAGVGAYKAYKANEEAIDNLVATIGTEFGGIWGTSNKKSNSMLTSGLTFSDGVSSQFSINVMQRNIIESDKSQTEPLAEEYFKSRDLYNYDVNKDNLGIEKINNDKKTTFSPIPLETLPATNPEIKTIADSEIFNNIKFTISDPNLTLVSVSLEKDGLLNMKIEITGTPTSYPVESFLNYSYSDGFSSTSGKLPIKVSKLVIGMPYQGGIIAYILKTGDQGYIEGEVHGLIAAATDQGIAEWGCYDATTNLSGADGSAIGTGNQNTIDIITGCSTSGIAARLCADLVIGEYSDWYLPSLNELKQLYENRIIIGGFDTDTYSSYWSSTEGSAPSVGHAEDLGFYKGELFGSHKNSTGIRVRAVRSF